MKLTIIYPVDLFGVGIGGCKSFLKGIIKNAPSDIEIEFIGITSDSHCPLKCWKDVKLGKKEFKFFPILYEQNANKRGVIPLSLRFTFALQGCKLNYSSRVLFFNRLEPAIFFKSVNSPKMLMIHNDIERQIKHKGSEVFWSRMPWLYFQLERYIFGFMLRIYTVSQNSLTFYKTEYPHLENRLSFFPTWVDDSIFRPIESSKTAIRKVLDFTDEDIQGRWVLFVGRLQEQKAPMRLIDTFKLFIHDDPNSRLIIIGEGNMQSNVEKYASRLEMSRQVIFVKSKEQEVLVKFYQAADILLLTSNYEGMPMSVLEALGCGLPVVSTDVGEVKRVVRNGISGEVVKDFDPINIAQAVRKVIDNPFIYSMENCIKSVEVYTPGKVLAPLYDNIRNLNKVKYE